jgi:RimJ/RimL family protein N-acetyltransferase
MSTKLINFSVRFVDRSDSRNMFEWRNDKISRQMSHTSKIIDWEQHSDWFTKSINSENRKLLICEQNSVDKIAIVLFDISETSALVSINLNPMKRGMNFAKVSLIKSIEFFLKKYPLTKKLYAEIKEENIASKKTFLGIGFKKYKVYKEVGYYIKNLV